ncbi:autotransporter outer membrane beta-barrel domain-containing protein [Siccibacter turicensis]|uniref:autotransporter family protein n=1 Tax=Siccibacter turicensis TaxID=357233 RepID=UPI002A6A37BF|nr:autotransporter outer membrane beta-barrel domain-containing protein [Siccibacter turicensis]MDY0971263.1 autotransporter outer membrane beta-barrel domain-containing protein [Siccibacter turicensis]
MNKSKAFRKNTITRLIAHAFPMALLFVPVMVNATTTVDKDTNSTYALMGDTEYIINPGVTMTGKEGKAGIIALGDDIESIVNNGTVKGNSASALEINITGQTSSMVTLENKGNISSNTTGIEVINDKNLTIINTGTISGGTSAISFTGNGSNALILKEGSNLEGDVTSATSTNNTITLNESGTEEANFIGVTKGQDGFKSLTMDGDKWTLTGNVDLIGSAADSLYVKTGALTLGGDVTNKGGSLIDSGASLQLGTGSGKNASLEGDIENNGTLIVNQAADYSWNNDISGTGSLIKQDANTLTLGGNNTYTGDSELKAGTTLVAQGATLGATGNTATLTVDSGATFASAGTVNQNLLIASGGTLAAWNAISGNTLSSTGAASTGDTINGNVTNQGTLLLASASNTAGNDFIINGDYTGAQGSTVVMNTVAGDDSSLTDHLAITGNSAGTSSVAVANVGGMGAQTLNGIEVIGVGGSSDAVFTLDKPVVAGAWEYNLNQHTDGNWYLESAAKQPDPDNGGNTPEIYRPEVGVYMANYVAAQQMFQHKRDDRDQVMLRDEDDLNTWMYVKGQYTDASMANNNLDYDISSTVMQLGSDVMSTWLSNGTLHSGFMLGVGHSDTSANAAHNDRSSSGNVEGYNVGLYATWQQDQTKRLGGYIDTWIAYHWFDNQVIGDDMPDEHYSSQGVAGSVEVGHAWLLPSEQPRTFKIEPQIQAIYSNLDQNDHVEANGTRITTSEYDSLTTRLGVRVGYVDQVNVEAWQPYVGAHWISGNGQSDMSFNDEKLDSGVADERYQAETGITGNLNPTTTILLRAVGEWGENDWSSYSGHVLLNHRW